MKALLKIILGCAALIIVMFGALSIFISTLDADKYRPQLLEAITKQTGRTAKLNGPIAFSLRPSGVHISIQDASIANPSWASRPNMAGMGKFEIGIGLLPLLSHHIFVKELSIENADILLETNTQGQHNWDFVTTPQAGVPLSSSEQHGQATPKSSVKIAKLTIVNSQLAIRASDGQVSSYNVANLSLEMDSKGANIDFIGDVNGTPITFSVKSDILNLMSKDAFLFDADAKYASIHLTAKGNADIVNGKADIKSYEITAGKTIIQGTVSAVWKGARPTIDGTLTSDHLDLGDFESDDNVSAPITSASADRSTVVQKAGSSSSRLFSDAPLPLSGLKAADGQLAITVGDFPLGKGDFKNLSAKLSLNAGTLILSPVKALVAGQPIDAQVKLDASQSPAHLTIGVIGNGVDLTDLQKLGNMTPFMTGKASANIQVTGTGDSLHEVVSSLGGVITITAEKGEIFGKAASGISSALSKVFNPQGGDAALNCLAARFIAKDGVLTDNGILIDSAPSTVSGNGSINLGTETIHLVLHANTKLVDIGGLVPALDVDGTLMHPNYSIDAASLVTNAVGALASGNLDVIASSVPSIQVPPSGQNACVFTLDHPQAASSSGILSTTTVGKATQSIQKLGGSVLKGLFGK